MARLTEEQIDSETKGRRDTTSLSLSHRALYDVSSLAVLSNLHRLDLSFNCLTNLEGLCSCANLKWLSVVENKITSLRGVQYLPNLNVLNAGRNKIKSMDEVKTVSSLRALILNDNELSSICKLDQLKKLNTLVLSHNPIHVIGDALGNSKSLTKLSLSHCQIETIGASLVACVELKEVRLSHNNILTLPTELARNIKLQNLDIGNNLIEKKSDFKVLSMLPNLKNLNIKGNPSAENEKLLNKIKKMVPSLRIFNSKLIESGGVSRRYFEEDMTSDQDSLPKSMASKAERDKKRKQSKVDIDTEGVRNLKPAEEKERGLKRSKRDSKKTFSVEREDEKSSMDVSNPKTTKKSKKSSDGGGSDIEVRKQAKGKKPKMLDGAENDNINMKGKNLKKQLNDQEGETFHRIDEVDTPFLDLIFSANNAKNEKTDIGIVDEEDGTNAKSSTKKKRMAKSRGKGYTTSDTFPATEIGMGGPSAWDL